MPSATHSDNDSNATGNGIKRKADASPESTNPKKGRKTEDKEQTTIEQTLPDKTAKTGHEGGSSCWFWSDNETYDTAKDETDTKNMKAGDTWKGTTKEGESKSDPEKALKDCREGKGINGMDSPDQSKKDAPPDDVHADVAASKDDAIEISKERADAMPSNLMEKGIIYFFTRGRVGIEDPESVTDLQRSFFVLRPLSPGAKLTDGAIEDSKNNRLFALPKKVWPKSPSDKFMAFVEKAKTSMDDLKESFFEGSQYATKTSGTRQNPPVTPVAEGVYALTKAGNRDETHLSYMMTIPREPGEMQEDIGLSSKGSFIVSLKNPSIKGPSYATLPETADFPQEYIEEFGGRSWMPAEPKHLDYANVQILLIGEDPDSSHALDATSKDEKSDAKETPAEELEKLEGEDELRVEHLKGDDSIFEDLHISSKDYPSVPTTW